MSAWDWMRVVGLLGPIVLLIVVGFVLAMRSGVAQIATTGGLRRAIENASEAALLVGGCLIGLALIHTLVGQRIGMIW